MTDTRKSRILCRLLQKRRRYLAMARDAGQTAIVAVLAITIVFSVLGVVLVTTVGQSFNLQHGTSVQVYANRALEAGQNAYLDAINTNSGLAQCSTATNGIGTCSGLNYGEWDKVTGSDESGADAEYYAFGNPQPTFDPTTHALVSLSVPIIGAAQDTTSSNGYQFDQETITVAPKNGFLDNVWWSNYESYSQTGNYSTCNYNYNLNYNISNSNVSCGPVYFAPGDYLFGPVFTNDSVFVGGNGSSSSSPSFGNPSPPSPAAAVASAVTTADPNCLFVDNDGSNDGMQGGHSNCAHANSEVALYDTTNSSFANPVESPPTTDASLGVIASVNGCLYSGPTQIKLSKGASGGLMTVSSPDTPVVNGQDADNTSGNQNSCPTDGTTAVSLPANGVVYVENATPAQTQAWANPFDGPIENTVTNVVSSPSNPAANTNPVVLTATVTSASNQIPTGASMTFSHATCNNTSGSPAHCTGWNASTNIGSCSAVSLGPVTPVTPATTPPTYTATASCSTSESSRVGDTFSASYSGGTYTSSSSASVGQNNTYSPSTAYGPDSQVTAGGCASCYYGETSSPDSEGDAFVNGSLSGELTVGTANNVVIDGNVTYADCGTTANPWVVGQSLESAPSEGLCPYVPGGPNDTLGLIANKYVEVNRPILASTSNNNNPTVLPVCTSPSATCDPSDGTNGITIDAAVLALTQSFVVNNYGTNDNNGGTHATEGNLTVYGSIQQFARGPVGNFSGTSLTNGYQKHYTWDPLLDFVSPPSYLAPTTAPWSLGSVAATPSTGTNTVCPPLAAPYGQTGTITQYCSGTGGLPGFPSSTAPSSPTNVSASETNGVVTVTWTDPGSNGGSAIGHYTVAPSQHCSTCAGMTVSGASSTSATITGLPAGSTYRFTVSATNANGTSNPSLASNPVIIPTAPSAPTAVTATVNTNGSVSVGWTASDNGSPITTSTVTASPACPTCTGTTVSGTGTTATITGLTPGTSYTFTVTESNILGTSPASAPSNAVTAPSVPGAPTIGTATAGNTQATLNWTAPTNTGGIPVTGYVVTPYKAGVAQATQTFNSTATTQTVTGLTNLSSYTFTVAAINAIGTGPASAQSNAVTPAAPPGAPTIGTATAGVNSATVTWTAPASNGGSAITGYVVTPYISGVAQATQTFNSTATTETVTGLAANTSYTFKVAAINAIGTGTQSAASNSITTPKTLPGAPTGVSATSGNTSVSLTWTAPTNSGGVSITGYVVTPYKAGVAQTAQTFNSAATTETVTGLTNGTSYTFTVAAINSVGTGAASAQSNAVIPATVPGAPTIGTATAGNASATVTWTAPASNGGSAITGYVVTPYKSGVAQTAQTFNSTATTETVTGLTNGTAYTFKVAAINGAGTGSQSAASNSVTPATVPGAPTITATLAANQQVSVTWTAPASNGGSAITGYVVTPYIGGVAQAARTFNSTTTTQTITGLSNGTAYTFTVAAMNAYGTGAQSAASAPTIPATTPGAPTIGTATAGPGSATVTWTAPASNGGSAINGYVVTPYKAGVAQTAQTFNSTATTETVTGLANNTAYTFTVAAINGMGTGPASAQSNSVTTPTTPGAPTIGTATAGVGSATVTWTAPASNGGSAITGYVVTPYIGATAQTAQTFNSTATTETVTGLANNTTYTFKVAAINGVGTGGQSAASNSVTTPTTPGAPTIGTATFGNASASLSWTAPASNGGSAITGYVVTPYIGGTAQATQTFNSTATTETVTGLTNGTAYTFKVAAINGVGTGSQSAASNSVTPATTPGAPTGVSGISGNTSVSLSWTAPASNGGSSITGYVVTPYIGGTAQATQTFNSTATTETVTSLTNGTAYTFTVAAINAVGTGSQSAASASVTPATTPGAPTIGTATAGVGSATVTWTAPASNGGSAITGYVVTPYIGGTAQTAQTFNSTATTETVTGLNNGTAYTFKVAAINGVGTGGQSAASNSVTTPSTPGAPTIGTATSGNAQATLSWTAPASNGGSAITGYVVTPYIGSTAQAAQTFNSTATTETVTGLTNGTAYTFKVAAINAVGTGSQSAASNSVTPATTPGAPTGVSGTSGNTSVSLSWTAPASNGGSAITGYVVTPYISGVAQATQTFNSTATTETVTGLTNGTAYTFTVAAINGVGTGAQSAASASVTPATTPGAPTIGTATAGVGSATVTWTAPASNGGSAITGYVVTPYIGSTAQTAQTFNSTATTETVTGLANGTAYTFKVAAINGVGTGSQSAASNSVTTPTTPGAPTIGTATSGNASVSLSWTAPASNGGSAITGYVVTPYIGGVAQATQAFNSTATTETVTGLNNGTAYTFKVAAINAVGTGSQSAASNSVTPATTPGAPTIGTATSGNTSVSLSWTAPASNGGSAITGYVVTPYIGGTAQATQTFNSTATTETVTGLTNGTAYTFTVAAINGVGTGAQSAASASVTPATTPGAPTIGTATAGVGSATVTWTAPASNGGSAISGYVVTPYIGGTAQATQTFNSTATTETVTGLNNNTAYTFTVAAINGVGTGAQSAASNSVTTPTTPGAPTIGTATFGNASASLSWTAPASNGGSAITGYVVTPYIGGTAQATQTFNSTATTETVTGLTNGTAYTFKVAAINGVGTGSQSAASNSVTPATTPGAPTGVSGISGNTSVSLSWTAPASNGGSAITGYVVTPYIGGTAQATQTFNSTATTETVTGLTNGTAYTFTVAAINSVGTGSQSAASASVTPATTPGAPTIGTATSGNASVSLSWTAPASNGGSAITGYVVTPYIGGTAQATQTFNSTATTETVTGLTNGTAYTFKVAAINGAGTGSQSAASNSVTPATTPGAPTGVSGTSGNTSVSLSWTAPASNGGSAITGYVVTPYIGGTAQATQTFNSTATTETVTGLTNGTAYTFTVAAINGVGTGSQSAASASVTPATTPGAPTIGTATAGNASVSLSWTAPASNGGSAITGYVVTPYIGGTAQATQTFNSTATTETVTGLTNGTAYTFKVAAINGVGTGSQSSSSNSATPITVAGAPTIGTATAGNAQATVSWTAPASNGGSAITGYVVTPYVGTLAQTAQTFNSTATTETVTGLTNGTTYTFHVAAINGAGTGAQSAASNSVTPATTPGAPTIGTGTSGNTSVSLSWTAPASNGGSAITGYVVTPYIGGVAQATQTFNSTATTETVTGLTNGTAYTFTVAAINGVGTGSQSAASASVTPATTPGAPTIGTATAGSSSASVSWTAPASNGGSAITGYVVTPYIGSTAQTAQTFNSTATTETVTSLTAGTAYTFKVAAINGAGTGSQSAASSSVTPYTVPGTPTGVTGSTGTTSKTVNISWTAPSSNGGSPITGYTVTAYTGTTQVGQATVTTTSNTNLAFSPALTSGTTYTFKVAATNAAGTGAQTSGTSIKAK